MTNSRQTRVQPVFNWLQTKGGPDWADRLVVAAEGLGLRPSCGAVEKVHLDPERAVQATPARLAWMIRNVTKLAPQDGKRWREPYVRTSNAEQVAGALSTLDAGGTKDVPKGLILEGATHADCLVECENVIIWIEGKRFDWIAPSTSWDVTRDQLARNLEAAWSLASPLGKEYCLIVCHEHPLKHHEQLLVDGYRAGTWVGGWPHLSGAQRREFGERIGTTTWSRMAEVWPGLLELSELKDLGAALSLR